MTHEEIKILISAYTDGEVSPSEKNIVEEHLKECASCQKDLQTYKAISSSLSKWPDETLSPDEEIKVQRSFQRREPMFTKRNMMAFGTTLALTIIIGSVAQVYVKKGVQGRLKTAADDIGDQYSDGNTFQKKVQIYRSRRAMPIYEAQFASSNVPAMGLMSAAPGLAASPMAAAYDADLSRQAPDRKIIKNANITLKVENAEKAQTALEGLAAKYNGVIGSLNIVKSDDGSRQGVMVFSVPPKDLDKILPELRKLGEVQSENQSSSDVTNQFAYVQRQLDHYLIQRENLRKLLKKNAQDIENNTYVQTQLTEVENTIDNLQNSMKSLDDQSFMATVTVNFYDTAQKTTPKEVNFKDKLINSLKDHFKSTVQTAYDLAISSFSGIFIVLSFLLQIAIWALLFWGIYLIVGRFFKK